MYCLYCNIIIDYTVIKYMDLQNCYTYIYYTVIYALCTLYNMYLLFRNMYIPQSQLPSLRCCLTSIPCWGCQNSQLSLLIIKAAALASKRVCTTYSTWIVLLVHSAKNSAFHYKWKLIDMGFFNTAIKVGSPCWCYILTLHFSLCPFHRTTFVH